MNLVRLSAPGGLENLQWVEEDTPAPGPGELLVRIRACSLNFRDIFVVQGKTPCADGRIPLSDGAGEVLAVGDGVEGFQAADHVVSTFYPYWLGGDMTPATRRDIPGDSVDGYASEYVCMPAHAFTKAPAGYTHVEAATLTCVGVTAWRGLVVCGQVKPGDTVLIAGEVSIPALFSNQIRISGISIGCRADQEDMIRAITVNRLKPVIDRCFPLREIGAAFRYYESQQHFGKVCLEL